MGSAQGGPGNEAGALSLWKNNALVLANPQINDIISLFDRAVYGRLRQKMSNNVVLTAEYGFWKYSGTADIRLARRRNESFHTREELNGCFERKIM